MKNEAVDTGGGGDKKTGRRREIQGMCKDRYEEKTGGFMVHSEGHKSRQNYEVIVIDTIERHVLSFLSMFFPFFFFSFFFKSLMKAM